MPTPINPQENNTTYVMNPEAAEETTRLLLLDRMYTKEMGGVFPASLDLSYTRLVLDLACGPGGWALDVARAYPNLDVIGVDISQKMIRYAKAHAHANRLENASFQEMDILKTLAFPDDTFDFVNARFLYAFMPTHSWPGLVQECLRITRPGGIIRLTEVEWPYSNGAASEKIADAFMRAMWLDGKSFAPDGKRVGITFALAQFLRDAGLLHIQQQPYAIEFSYGTEAHEAWYQNFMIGYPLVLPFLIKMGVTTSEEFAKLYEQVSMEMQETTFRGINFFLSVWGTKAQQ